MFRRSIIRLGGKGVEHVQSAAFVDAIQVRERDVAKLQSLTGLLHMNIAANLQDYAPHMILSKSLPEAQFYTRAFYRKIIRLIPTLLKNYTMNEISPTEASRLVKVLFREVETQDYETMDNMRWDGEVVFTDAVRMYLTQSHVISILYRDRNPTLLPTLPVAALPPSSDPDLVEIMSDPSDFLATFLDPTEAERKVRRVDVYGDCV